MTRRPNDVCADDERSDDAEALGRRAFLGVCAGALATLSVAGCATVMAQRVASEGGRVTLPFARFPELLTPGGSLVIHPYGMTDPLFVLRIADRRYAVLSPICTHRGCTVELAGERLRCPCHGSTYDRQGAVLIGPAERALTRLAVTVDDDRLTIDLGRPA